MIKIPSIANKKYAVLGLGKSGLATAASLRVSGAKVFVWDDQEKSRKEAQDAGHTLLDFLKADVADFSALVLSPGIPHTHPTPHKVVERFRAAKVDVIGDIELLFRACPDATYIGITGTNGKSTTTALIGHILKSAGRKIEVGGNLGTAALSLAPLDKKGIYVLELSSYQLELIDQNLISIAVLLNITPDHLSRHGGMEGYVNAKKRIIAKNDHQTLVIGIDDEHTAAIKLEAKKNPKLTVIPISLKHEAPGGVQIVRNDLLFEDKKILDLTSLRRLPGAHNAQNIGAAFAVCHSLGLDRAEILSGISSFPGLAHRQQLVAEIKGVRFVNDSKATNADAAEKALLCYDDIYWIIGGQAKEGGLKGLESYAKRIRHAYIIGEASDQFAAWCETNHIPHTKCKTLDKAVPAAAIAAIKDKIKGSVVLLSPACASWDQFLDFEDRGDQFSALVRALPKDI